MSRGRPRRGAASVAARHLPDAGVAHHQETAYHREMTPESAVIDTVNSLVMTADHKEDGAAACRARMRLTTDDESPMAHSLQSRKAGGRTVVVEEEDGGITVAVEEMRLIGRRHASAA